MKAEIVELKLSDIVFDEAIYPRAEHTPAKAQEYAEHIEAIEEQENYIHIDNDNRLVDGRHRHLAYLKLADGDDPTIKAYKYGPDVDSSLLAIRLNSSHGQQLTQDDKRRNCVKLYAAGYTIQTIQQELSVSYSFAQKATKAVREQEKKDRQEKIFRLWLACYTQRDIAEAVGLSQKVVADEIETLSGNIQNDKTTQSRDFDKDDDFKPPLYNVWTYARKSNDVGHFGNSEQTIVDNLLYLYTKAFDIVVDPFAGGGSTIDVCRRRLRRYWCSDRKPIPEREHEIRKHDIVVDGSPPLHRNWSNVTLTYLDPPYWRQAQNQYSDDPTYLANMPLEQFTETLVKLVQDIAGRQKQGVIALLIQPSQWKADDRQFTDHVFDIVSGVGNKRLVLKNRILCPSNSEQYNAQQVEWAKEHRKPLVLTRELIVWRINS